MGWSGVGWGGLGWGGGVGCGVWSGVVVVVREGLEGGGRREEEGGMENWAPQGLMTS